MKKTLLLLIVALAFLGCEQTVTLDVEINWGEDETYFNETCTWYAVAAEGTFIFDMEGYDGFGYEEVTPGTDTNVSFTIDASEGAMYTVGVFPDTNGNGEYDPSEEYLIGSKYEWADPGDNISIEITPYY